jgi:hypothetical protein
MRKSNFEPQQEPAPSEENAAQPPPNVSAQAAPGTAARGRLDQLGAIVAKGLDLAEASVSLGVTILTRVGSAAQRHLREMAPAAPVANPMESQTDSSVGSGPNDASEGAPPTPESTFGITNRLPLMPGGVVRISFSVNNDSLTEAKTVELKVDGFVGDAHGGHIDANAFAVAPASKTIAPADFEKFILRGQLPTQLAPDIYRGAIIVGAESELVIPVVLVVSML